MIIKEELQREFSSLSSKLVYPGAVLKPHIFDLNNEGDIYQQLISMLTEDEMKMINRYFAIILDTNPDFGFEPTPSLDIIMLKSVCKEILRNLFKIPEYSTINDNNSNNSSRKRLRKYRFFPCLGVSMKFLRNLEIIKNSNIYDNDKPLVQKFDYNENRRYV